MANIALIVVFALALSLSIQSVVGDDLFTPEQVDKFKSEVKDAAATVSDAAGKAKDKVEDTSATWTNWAKDHLSTFRDFGLLSPKETMSAGSDSASSPENSATPAGDSSSYGSEPAAAPAS